MLTMSSLRVSRSNDSDATGECSSGVRTSESVVSSRSPRSPSSVSVNSNHSTGTNSSAADSIGSNDEQEDMVTLTNYVQQFREVIAKLRQTCDQRFARTATNKRETFRVQVHERLGDVLKILRIILTKYSAVQSTELLVAAGNLIKQVKTFNYENEKADKNILIASIEQLALAFSNRVSEYLIEDIDADAKCRSTNKCFSTGLESEGEEVPKIVVKCIEEVEKHGQSVQGLYRVSGVKSKVENLCRSFQNGADSVDLSDVHPIVTASVLKLFLRQLPEPLLTFRYYTDFIHVAKKYPLLSHDSTKAINDDKQIIGDLRNIVSKLPLINKKTLTYLMHHLKRISESPDNNMPASNLGIVFGPTLLRTKEDDSALTSLMDTVHQTRIVELLITFAQQVFGSSSPIGDDDSEDDSKPANAPLLRGGKHVDFSSIIDARTTTREYSSHTVITLSGQSVVTSTTTTTTPTKQSLYELRRQFFSAPYSPPRFHSLPLSMPIDLSNFTSNANSNSSVVTKHTLMRTSSSSQLTSHANNVVAQELRPSTSSQAIRLIDDEENS